MKAWSGKNNRQYCTRIENIQYGFTLLEVLVATSILGVMMLLLFGSLRVCSRSWNAGEEHIRTSSQMTVVQNFFRTYITSALVVDDSINIDPLENLDEDTGIYDEENQGMGSGIDDEEFSDQGHVSFQGNEHELQFVSVMPASAGRGGPQVFTIALKQGETQQLVVTIMPFYPFLDDTQEVIEEVSILDKVKKFAITYWGTREFSDGPEWNYEWNERHLPKMVRIEIEREDEPAWPAMIVSPRLAIPTEESE